MKKQWKKLHDDAMVYAKAAAHTEYARLKVYGKQPDFKDNKYIKAGEKYAEGLREFPDWYKWKTGNELRYIQKKLNKNNN